MPVTGLYQISWSLYTMADKAAAIFAQNVSDLLFILRHYADIPTLFSNWKFSLFAEG